MFHSTKQSSIRFCTMKHGNCSGQSSHKGRREPRSPLWELCPEQLQNMLCVPRNSPFPLPVQVVIMGMLVRMIGPVLVCMGMHGTGQRQFVGLVSVRALKVIGMIMPTPQVLRMVVGNKQALPMMPAITENVVIFLAFGRSLILAQALPLTMHVFLNTLRYQWCSQDAISSSFEEKTVVDIHQAIKTEFLVDPTDLGEQFTTKCQQVTLNGINIRPRSFTELAQIVGYQTIGSNNADVTIRESGRQGFPDITGHLNRSIHEDNVTSATGSHGCIASSSETHVMIGKKYLQSYGLAIFGNHFSPTRQMLEIGQGVIGRAIIDDDEFDVAAIGMTTNALDAALQVLTAIMGQQVDRKLKTIRCGQIVGGIAGAGQYGKLFFWTTRQNQRAIGSIADSITGLADLCADVIGLCITGTTTQTFAFMHLLSNFGRDRCKICL